jgi:hypothetical protein
MKNARTGKLSAKAMVLQISNEGVEFFFLIQHSFHNKRRLDTRRKEEATSIR